MRQEPDIVFRIVHAPFTDGSLPVAFHDQAVEVALGPNPAFSTAHFGALSIDQSRVGLCGVVAFSLGSQKEKVSIDQSRVVDDKKTVECPSIRAASASAAAALANH